MAHPDGRGSIHRQTYIDLVLWRLQSFGSKGKLAAELGKDPGFLSGLLAPPSSSSRQRTPSPALADHMTEILWLDAAHQEIVLYHMQQARRRSAAEAAPNRAAMPYQIVDQRASEFFSLFEQHVFWSETGDPGISIPFLLDAGRQLLSEFDPVRHSHPYVRVLIALGECWAAVGRPDLALHYARTAQLVINEARANPAVGSRISSLDWNRHSSWYDLRIARLEVPTLVALGRAKQADELGKSKEGEKLFRDEGWYWAPRLHLNRIVALSHIPRSSVPQMEHLHEQGVNAAKSWSDDYSCTLLDSALVEGFVTQGSNRSLKKAEQLVEIIEADLKKHSQMSRLHRQRAHRALARFFQRVGAEQEYAKQQALCRTLSRSLAAPAAVSPLIQL